MIYCRQHCGTIPTWQQNNMYLIFGVSRTWWITAKPASYIWAGKPLSLITTWFFPLIIQISGRKVKIGWASVSNQSSMFSLNPSEMGISGVPDHVEAKTLGDRTCQLCSTATAFFYCLLKPATVDPMFSHTENKLQLDSACWIFFFLLTLVSQMLFTHSVCI